MQDIIKKGSNDELPDFYNIVLERPKDDAAGYDVLFVDAASKVSHADLLPVLHAGCSPLLCNLPGSCTRVRHCHWTVHRTNAACLQGGFASRMSHSCTPNCHAVVMAAAGKLTIALYTLRQVGSRASRIRAAALLLVALLLAGQWHRQLLMRLPGHCISVSNCKSQGGKREMDPSACRCCTARS